MHRCATLLLSALFARATASRADCGYGGVFTSGACACRPEWSGPNCTQLNLLPASNALAFSGPSGNVSSWGGSVQRLRGGGYAMAVAVMAGHCGLGTWEGNSEIVLARAATPDGPFAPQRVLLAPFSHNPTLHYTPNGSLLIAHIGQGKPYHPLNTNCSGGFTPPGARAAAAKGGAPPPLRLGVHGAALPPPNFLLLASGNPDDGSEWVEIDSGGGGWAANNPALLIDAANGSALLVYKVHCPCPNACFCAQFGVATAPSWDGPYTDRGLIPVYGEECVHPPSHPPPGARSPARLFVHRPAHTTGPFYPQQRVRVAGPPIGGKWGVSHAFSGGLLRTHVPNVCRPLAHCL